MNNVIRIGVVGVALWLAGCANSVKPVTGSNKGDYAAGGAVLGGTAGYALCKAGGGSDVACRNMAIAGAAVGGYAGYKHGEAIDIRIANERAEAIRKETGFKPVVKSKTIKTTDGDAKVLDKMEIPIARSEMFAANGKLSAKASDTLASMDKLAVETGADYAVMIPARDIGTKQAIQDAAQHAALYRHDGDQFVILVKPKKG